MHRNQSHQVTALSPALFARFLVFFELLSVLITFPDISPTLQLRTIYSKNIASLTMKARSTILDKGMSSLDAFCYLEVIETLT